MTQTQPNPTSTPRRGRLPAVALALAATALLLPASASARLYHNLEFTFNGSETPAGSSTPTRIAFSAGHLFVADSAHQVVDRYSLTPTGAAYECQITGLGSSTGHSATECDTSTPGPGRFASLGGLASDPSTGALYVAESGQDEHVHIRATSAPFTLTFEAQTTPPLSGSSTPAQVQAALEGLSTIGAHNVYVLRPEEGEFSVVFVGALAGTDVGPLTAPGSSEVEVLASGAPSHLDRFSPAGLFEKRTALPSAADHGLAVSAASGNLLIPDQTHVFEWNPAGSSLADFSIGADTPAGAFGDHVHLPGIAGVAADNDPASPNYGDLYVSDPRNHVIDRLSPSGAYQCQLTGAGAATTSPSECDPSGPALASGPDFYPGPPVVDPSSGRLYAGDTGSPGGQTVAEFSPSGEVLAVVHSAGQSNGLPWVPVALAVRPSSGELVAADSGNFVGSPPATFVLTPDLIAPDATTEPPTAVTPTTATLRGAVNPDGLEVTQCRFEYVEEAKYDPAAPNPYAAGQSVACEQTVGEGTAPVPVSAHLSGLTAGLTYHYRLEAQNANQDSETYGSDEVFGPPVVHTSSADQIAPTSATLHAALDPNGLETSYHFEYTTLAEYEAHGFTGAARQPSTDTSIGSGTTDVSVQQSISGLQLATSYRYRVVATSSDGTSVGPTRSFETLPPALIDAQPAASVGASNATLQAYLDPLGLPTSYRFEWGTTTAYGNSTQSVNGAAAASPLLREAPLGGLEPATTYHFRLLASNSLGTVEGPDETFTTEPAPGSCENEPRREEQGPAAQALPECRAYEMVTPPDKAGYPATHPALATTGERLIFESQGAFAGTPNIFLTQVEYLARRGESGWSTVPNLQPRSFGWTQVITQDAPDLSRALIQTNINGEKGTLFFHDLTTGAYEQAFPEFSPADGLPIESLFLNSHPSFEGASEDLSLAVFKHNRALLPSEPGPDNYERLYELAGIGGSSPVLRPLLLDSAGDPLPRCPIGNSTLIPQAGGASPVHARYAISADGSRVFFTIAPEVEGKCLPPAIYAREDGQRTIAVSAPQPNEACTIPACRGAALEPAVFEGASADGSKAFFLSTQQLTDEASQDPVATDAADRSCAETTGPGGCNLYLYDFARPEGRRLIDVSAGDSSGLGPQVRHVLNVSSDGARVYFTAAGVLTAQPNSLDQTARPGAENLYAYDTASERISFLAQLCTGEERSGSLTGVATCPESDAEYMGRFHSYSTPDGGVLAFTSYSQITPDDQNAMADVYRYAAASGAISRVSVGHDREDQNGNAGGHGAVLIPGPGGPPGTGDPASLSQRPMSNDGATIVFATARPLQAADTNEKSDAYEWHQGQVSLISTGKGKTDVPLVGGNGGNGGLGGALTVDPSGRDIIFTTDQGILLQDFDGLQDVYDARAGGGFRYEPPGSPCESPEGCGRHPGEPPQQPNITHGEFPPNELHCHRGFVKRHGKCVKARKHKRRRHHKRTHKRPARPNRGAGK